MGWFSFKNPPDTIDDDKWDRIRKAAIREEARRGGMFTREAVERRKKASAQRSKRRAS